MAEQDATWRQNRAGLAASLLLHMLAVGLWLSWSMAHPPRQAPPLKAMLVDLVNMPAPEPGLGRGAPAATPPRRASAPHIESAPHIAGVRPQALAPPPDALEAQIAALAHLSRASSALPAPDNDGIVGGIGGGAGHGGNYALADFVRAQILRRWWPDLTSGAARGMPVALQLKMTRAGVISNVRIVDQQRFANDKLFHGMALSARNAAILASPIVLPPGNYDAVMEIAVTLDPRAVLH